MSWPINPETSIRRIYTDQPLAAGETVALDHHAAKHIITVCRHRAGDRVVLFNGDGHEYTGQLLAPATAKACHVAIETATQPVVESDLTLTLVQAIGRGERMDWAIQKAVELGVARIVPVISERVNVKLDDKRALQRQKRWHAIVVSACEQSGRVRVPVVEPPVRLEDHSPDADQLMIYLDPMGKTSLAALESSPNITLWVGPEGGWTPAETAYLDQLGAHGVRLGHRILRTETAGMVCLASIHALWGDFVDGR